MLSTDAQHELGVKTATDGFTGNPTCQWSPQGGFPLNRWQFELDSGYGAEAALAMDGAQLTTVDGFGAVETDALDHGTSCRLWVDVAPGQNLNVTYSDSDGTRRDIDHELACQLSGQAAELVVENLATLANHPIKASRAPLIARPVNHLASHPAARTPSPFAPRPAQLRLTGIDPCSLLTPALTKGLGGQNYTTADNGPVNYCTWRRAGLFLDVQWTVKLVTYRSAATPEAGSRPPVFGTLDGFGVAETADPQLGPDITCRLSIDVADGQSVEIDYQSLQNANPAGMSHQVACQHAYQLAGPVLSNLRARQ